MVLTPSLIEGIQETENQVWKECKENVKALIQEKLGLERVEIDRMQRAGRKYQNRKRVFGL